MPKINLYTRIQDNIDDEPLFQEPVPDVKVLESEPQVATDASRFQNVFSSLVRYEEEKKEKQGLEVHEYRPYIHSTTAAIGRRNGVLPSSWSGPQGPAAWAYNKLRKRKMSQPLPELQLLIAPSAQPQEKKTASDLVLRRQGGRLASLVPKSKITAADDEEPLIPKSVADHD